MHENTSPMMRTCGIDEVGRGPWAGNVVAAAIIIPEGIEIVGLTDSKKLSAKKREALAPLIHETCHVGIGEASVAEIDQLNISNATFLAMTRALAALQGNLPPEQRAQHALIDGNAVPHDLPIPATAVIGGDGTEANISAASIVAKVHRDAQMAALAQEFPHFGWERNAGYGTKTHQEGLADHGITPHHRTSFAPIRKLMQQVA